MNTATLAYFLPTAALLTLAPGPDIMFLLATSLAHGTKSGIALAAGLASGLIVHTTLVILGVAALVRSSPLALVALKYLGALYLLYLAWGALRDKSELRLGIADAPKAFFALWRRGILMNVLNPKVLLFFLMFFPQFIPSGSENTGREIAVLGGLFSAQAFLIFSAVALCAGNLRRVLLRRKGIGRVLHITEGAVLLFIVAWLLL